MTIESTIDNVRKIARSFCHTQSSDLAIHAESYSMILCTSITNAILHKNRAYRDRAACNCPARLSALCRDENARRRKRPQQLEPIVLRRRAQERGGLQHLQPLVRALIENQKNLSR
jgi:hypothetical protein